MTTPLLTDEELFDFVERFELTIRHSHGGGWSILHREHQTDSRLMGYSKTPGLRAALMSAYRSLHEA